MEAPEQRKRLAVFCGLSRALASSPHLPAAESSLLDARPPHAPAAAEASARTSPQTLRVKKVGPKHARSGPEKACRAAWDGPAPGLDRQRNFSFFKTDAPSFESQTGASSSIDTNWSTHASQLSYCEEEYRRKLKKKPMREFERHLHRIDLTRIRLGIDKRTSVMIKNIPNKYTQELLLQKINASFKGTYDFLYLPIDFKNKCNVGYAFINFIEPATILRCFEQLNGQKWEHFRSAKLCELAYARIQGVKKLADHFRRSSVMSQEAHMRPIIIDS